MSFSIDLWNGLNIIKERFVFTYNKVQLLYNIFNSFINMEKDYTKNLDILYKDHKDHIKEEFLLDTAFIQLLEMIRILLQNILKLLRLHLTMNQLELL